VPLAGSAKIAQRFPAAPAVTSSAALRAKLPQVRVVFARARYTDRCGFRGTGKGVESGPDFPTYARKSNSESPPRAEKVFTSETSRSRVDLETLCNTVPATVSILFAPG
jgi:hypothetical protein